MILPNIEIKADDLKDLGKTFAERLTSVEDARDELMSKTWKQSLEYYEGKTPPIDWPWPNANNSNVPILATHVDVFQAKLYNAGTAHDPIYMILPVASEDMLAGVMKTDEYADAMQIISKWAEKHQVNHAEALEEVTTLLPKYGDAFVLTTWEHETVADISFDEKGMPVVSDTPRDLINHPVMQVRHAKNVYLPMAERDVQLAPWIGVDREYTVEQIRHKGEIEEWYPKQVDALLKALGEKTTKERKKEKKEGWFRTTGDGRIVTQDELEEEQARLMRVNEVDDDPGRARLVQVFARLDTDKDGLAEEVNFLIHKETGIIVSLRHNHWMHLQRPIEHLYFVMREGVWLSIGAAEMLLNVQKTLNDIIRDMLNNNQIKNTSIYVGRATGDIDDQTVIYPSRLLLVDNPKEDFQVLNLGSGQISVSMSDINLLTSWAERRDGLTDHNLGREKTSRTPATTLLALLEEGSERIERVVDRMRMAQGRIWNQVLALYIQEGIPDKTLVRLLGAEVAAKIQTVWDTLSPSELMNYLTVDPKVSSKTFNRSIQRQETMALYGQLEVVYKRLFGLVQAWRQTANDPVMNKLITLMAGGLHRLMRRILLTYDEKDHRDLNPDVVKLLESGATSPTDLMALMAQNPFGDNGERSNQVEQALGIAQNDEGGGQPANVDGRPAAGQPRVEG